MSKQQRSQSCSGVASLGLVLPPTQSIHPSIPAHSRAPIPLFTFLSICSPACPLGSPHPGSPRVQTCRLPCTFLPTVHSTVPRALARVIQGLVWGEKALLRACPLTCGRE